MICAVFFVAVAASTVAIPILAYAAAGIRLDDALGTPQRLDGEKQRRAPCGDPDLDRPDAGLQGNSRSAHLKFSAGCAQTVHAYRCVQGLLLVAEDWSSVLTKLVLLGLVIALSPITVIPAVLVLHAPRPRPASLAFLGGWLLGLTGLTAAFIAASDLLGELREAPPTWASWTRVVLGSALIAFGIYRLLTRHRQTDPPAWMRPFAKLTPVRAGLVGAVLAPIRPEVLIVCAQPDWPLALADSATRAPG